MSEANLDSPSGYVADFLEHGTVEEHLATIKRAITNEIINIWTGDITRNKYLQENLKFAQVNGLVKITEETDYEGQASYWLLEWLIAI